MAGKPTPYQIPRFRGLDLRERADENGPQTAIDILNTDLDKPGAVRTRDGLAKFNSSAAAANIIDARSWTVELQVIMLDDAGDLRAYDLNGGFIAALAASHSGLSIASLGTGAAGPFLYVGGNPAGQIVRWSGSAWTSPAGMPNGRFVAIQPTENRLVAAYTAVAEESRVKFSDAGTPETWTSANFVDLHPHDGGVITAMVTWRNDLYVFKSTGKMYVFYGNSTDADGNPIFNYRTVDPGPVVYPDGALAAADGIYLNCHDGIYLTTGGPARKISQALDPIYNSRSTGYFTLFSQLTLQSPSLQPVAFEGRILFPQQTSTTPTFVTFVYYPASDDWSVWTFLTGGAHVAAFLNPAQPEILVVKDSSLGSTTVYKTSASATDDDGTVIASRYRSSFYSPIGSPSQECTVRESIIDGIGSPSFSVSRDYGAVPTTGGGAKATVTLSNSSTSSQGWHANDQAGRRFSYQIEATSGAWLVESIVQHITGIRSPGLRTAA